MILRALKATLFWIFEAWITLFNTQTLFNPGARSQVLFYKINNNCVLLGRCFTISLTLFGSMSYVLGLENFYGIKILNTSYEWNMPGMFIGMLNTYWPGHFYTIGSGRFGSSLVRRCCGPCRRRGGGKLSRNHRRRSQSRTCKTWRTPRKPFNQVLFAA